ncbi:ATP-binding protein [Candidatus Woesearchaeota archaeon]|nr:ATP-binding protein [Candidatus Woesearchaeota archaeon]
MKELLVEWNPWWDKEYEYRGVKREIMSEVLPWIKRKEILALLGVRRSGKTTLLYEVISDLIITMKAHRKQIMFIKADDDRIKADSPIDVALQEYKDLMLPEGTIFLFIDEIQEIEGWHKTLKRIYDLHQDIKIVITGSNASVLKEELGSFLAGRFAYLELFPFSFHEFVGAKGIEAGSERDMIKQKNRIRHSLKEYITYGAFPEVVLEKNEQVKKQLVSFYFDSILYRDIVKRKNLRNPAKVEKLVKYLLQNIANLANFSRIGKLVDLTTDSVGEYIAAFEDAYLIYPVNLLAYSYKQQVINPKKIYCVDTGLRNAIGFTFSTDAGRLYENIVYLALRRKHQEIFYFKGKTECDFIAKDGKEMRALQVSYHLKESKEREIAGLLEAMHEHKLNEGWVITDDEEGTEKKEGRTVHFVPLWKWLLKG